MTTSLVAVLVRMRPLTPLSLKSYMGRAVHQFVLTLADHFKPKSDLGLANWMHHATDADDSYRPYTACGPFHSFGKHPVLARGNITPYKSVRIRITALHERVAAMLCAATKTDPFVMEFDNTQWEVEQVVFDKRYHPACESYETLRSRYAGSPPRQFEIAFLTPTLIRTRPKGGDQQYVPLPIPARIFADLAQRWNAFAPPDLRLNDYLAPDDLEGHQRFMQRVEQSIYIDQCDVQAFPVEIHHQRYRNNPPAKVVGFVGSAQFENVATNRTFSREVATLVDFAFFAGVGRKTTAGMGLVRPSFLYPPDLR